MVSTVCWSKAQRVRGAAVAGKGQTRPVCGQADHDDSLGAGRVGANHGGQSLRAGAEHRHGVADPGSADGVDPAHAVSQHCSDHHADLRRDGVADSVHARSGRQVEVLPVGAPEVRSDGG